MFEEDEEQQQGVGPLKAALEEAAAAAEAQGRSKQPGKPRPRIMDPSSSSCFLKISCMTPEPSIPPVLLYICHLTIKTDYTENNS